MPNLFEHFGGGKLINTQVTLYRPFTCNLPNNAKNDADFATLFAIKRRKM